MEILVEIIKRKCETFLIVAMVIYILYTSSLTIYKHYSFQSSWLDLGVHAHALWRAVFMGELLTCGGFFRGHFTPILLTLIPIYALVPRVETLLVVQSITLASGALIIYYIAGMKFNSKIDALILALIYLLYLPLHDLHWFDFHFEVFIPITLLLVYLTYELRMYKLTLLSSILALSCCEFMPIIVVAFSLYFILNRKYSDDGRALKYSLLILWISALWLPFSLSIMRTLSSGKELTRLGEVWRWRLLLREPLTALRLLDKERILYPVYLLSPLFFIPLAGVMETIFLLGAWIVPAWLSNYPFHYGGYYAYQHQYGAFIIAQVFIALINGLKYLKMGSTSRRKLLMMMLLLNALNSVLLSPMGMGLLHHPKRPYISDHDKLLHHIISYYIPPDAPVLTQNDLGAHLCNREQVYCWPLRGYSRNPPRYIPRDVEYILMDLSTMGSALISHYALISLANKTYGILLAIDYVLLLKYNYSRDPIELNLERGYLLRVYRHMNESRDLLLEMPVSTLEHLGRFSVLKEVDIEVIAELYLPQSGVYRFLIEPNSTIAFYIDNLLVGIGKKIYLKCGRHVLRLVQYGRPVGVIVYWTTPWNNYSEPIPLEYVKPPSQGA